MIAGCAYYAIKMEAKYLGYSYSLCICGGSGAVVAGFLLCLDCRRDSQSDTEVVHTQQVRYSKAYHGLPQPNGSATIKCTFCTHSLLYASVMQKIV